MQKPMLAALLIVCATTGGYLGWQFAVAWYEELGAEPVPMPPVKTYVQLVGRQDCRIRGWECMTAADRFQADPPKLAMDHRPGIQPQEQMP